MKKGVRIGLGIFMLLLGWLSMGIAYSVPLGGQPYNTIVLLSGMFLFLGGIVFFIYIATGRKRR